MSTRQELVTEGNILHRQLARMMELVNDPMTCKEQAAIIMANGTAKAQRLQEIGRLLDEEDGNNTWLKDLR